MDVRFEVLPTQLPRVDLSRRTALVPLEPDGDELDEFLDEGLEDVYVEVPQRHSPVGLSLGGGLFLDQNGNLSLVPYRMFHGPLVPPEAVRVEIDPPGPFNARRAEAPPFSVQHHPDGLTIAGVRITKTSDGLLVDGKQGRVKVTWTDDGATVKPAGWGTWSTTVRRQGEVITLNPPGLFNRVSTTVNQEGTITVRSPYNPLGDLAATTIKRTEEGITIDPPGWFNATEIRFDLTP